MRIGTPNTKSATRVLMLGSGELGKEVVIELQRLGVEVIAGDRYASAPAMQVGHRQVGGDYHESWQPQPMSDAARAEAERMAGAVTDALGGYGVFGVEFFVSGDTVWFSEVSPRPHDTGMVTMVSQDLSEFALHARAILGLPIPRIRQLGPGASAVILGHGDSNAPAFSNLDAALAEPDVQIRLFGKPEVRGERRLGVALALAEDTDGARAKAAKAAKAAGAVEVHL